jgi:hypothetical protein
LKEEDKKDEVTKVNEEERSSKEEEDEDGGEKYTEKVIKKRILSHPSHYLSPSFLSVILLITSLPPSFQSSSPLLHPSFLSIRHLITSLLFPVMVKRYGKGWR